MKEKQIDLIIKKLKGIKFNNVGEEDLKDTIKTLEWFNNHKKLIKEKWGTKELYWVMNELEKHSEHETLEEAREEAKRFKWGARIYKVKKCI